MCSIPFSEINSGTLSISFWNSKQICPVDFCQERSDVDTLLGKHEASALRVTHQQEDQAAWRPSPPGRADRRAVPSLGMCPHRVRVWSLCTVRHIGVTPIWNKITPLWHTALSILAITSTYPDSYVNITLVMLQIKFYLKTSLSPHAKQKDY